MEHLSCVRWPTYNGETGSIIILILPVKKLTQKNQKETEERGEGGRMEWREGKTCS